MRQLIHNPILSGFYPDPSICRVKDDYYLVASSFSYFPGVPIFHSKDLAHWEQIGHVLDRPEQLPLAPYDLGLGIFAPTIREHDGVFYMVTTNASIGANFIVTATDPAGPWSAPHWILGAEGIDPSLFWDDDGTMYITGATERQTPNGPRPAIWMSRLDPETFELTGEKEDIWSGSMAEPAWTEAPHIYKKDGYYYLFCAEGGTEYFHSEVVARATSVHGPYESYRGNPILTQRHLGMTASITNAGHGDLVQCTDGSWYMVFLACRPYDGYHIIMGRETFIAPVTWEEGWPVVHPGCGEVQLTYEGPEVPSEQDETNDPGQPGQEPPYHSEQKALDPAEQVVMHPAGQEYRYVAGQDTLDRFDSGVLPPYWMMLGTKDPRMVQLREDGLYLRAAELPMSYDMPGRPAEWTVVTPRSMGFLGRRQQHKSFVMRATMHFEPKDGETAGMTVLQNDYQQLRLEMRQDKDGHVVLRAVRGYKSLVGTQLHVEDRGTYREEILAEIPWMASAVTLEISAKNAAFTLAAEDEDGNRTVVAEADGGFLGSETAGGFIGTVLGLFASGNGTDHEDYARFTACSYQGIG